MGADQGNIEVGNGQAVHPAIAGYLQKQIDEKEKKLKEEKRKEEERKKKAAGPSLEEQVAHVHPLIQKQILQEEEDKRRREREREEKKRAKEKAKQEAIEAEKQRKIMSVHPSL